jgi:hypothetical protein
MKTAVVDCMEIYAHAWDDLARTLDGIDADSVDGLTKGGHQLLVCLAERGDRSPGDVHQRVP